ncbi:WXG100 family type VII secretion target [Psychromicrobium xiongbiense]|uniref:WXG100 family type VII secretion target n=1 Tax=Psychromicrobium xiongbiense TaxID=3051184 RepID=UPI002557A509|nr:hypothetical protein [Psychromicrobium sp. YIM S02556]
MSAKFEADETQIALFLQELAAVTMYCQELLDQVSAGTGTITAGWDGAAALAFDTQMGRWQAETDAMIGQVDHFIALTGHAVEQYQGAGDAARKGWL